MKKLVDMFGTKYFYESWLHEINTLDETELDIADARFTTKIYAHLVARIHITNMLVIDSQDSFRNSVLEQNRSAQKLQQEVAPCALQYPPITPRQDIISYLKSFDENKVYNYRNFSADWSLENSLALITLLAITNPRVKIYMSLHFQELYAFIKSSLGYYNYERMLRENSKFTYIYGGAPLPVTLNLSQDRHYLPGYGSYPLSRIITDFLLLPEIFGYKRLISNPLWSPVVDACIKLLSPLFISRNFSMKQFILEGVSHYEA